ncbi:hypothetical protein J6590_069939 [Homalodisca vitripennis]|nr:hypothetical protein J6590_069939 [Homalodisca vitripennis]
MSHGRDNSATLATREVTPPHDIFLTQDSPGRHLGDAMATGPLSLTVGTKVMAGNPGLPTLGSKHSIGIRPSRLRSLE